MAISELGLGTKNIFENLKNRILICTKWDNILVLRQMRCQIPLDTSLPLSQLLKVSCTYQPSSSKKIWWLSTTDTTMLNFILIIKYLISLYLRWAPSPPFFLNFHLGFLGAPRVFGVCLGGGGLWQLFQLNPINLEKYAIPIRLYRKTISSVTHYLTEHNFRYLPIIRKIEGTWHYNSRILSTIKQLTKICN